MWDISIRRVGEVSNSEHPLVPARVDGYDDNVLRLRNHTYTYAPAVADPGTDETFQVAQQHSTGRAMESLKKISELLHVTNLELSRLSSIQCEDRTSTANDNNVGEACCVCQTVPEPSCKAQ